MYGCLGPATIYLAFLESLQQFGAGFEFEVKDLANALECGFDRFVEWSFSINAMDDIDCLLHFAHFSRRFRAGVVAMIFAGTPAVVIPGGTSLMTTAPAPTTLAAPMDTR